MRIMFSRFSFRSVISLAAILTLLVLVACSTAATTTPNQPAATSVPAPTEATGGEAMAATEVPNAMPHPISYPPSEVIPSGSLISATSYLGFQGVDTNNTQDSTTKVYLDEVFDYAISQTPDGNLTPGFATDWQVSADMLTWTFTIRDGMKFHNGETITPEDVAWTWNRAVSSDAIGAFALEVGPLLASEFTVSGNTVSVTTTEPQSTLPLSFASVSPARSYVWPQAYFESVGGIEGFRDNPIGSGPYQWSERVPGQYIELTAFADHYEKNPGYQTVQIWDVSELNTRLAMVNSGNADLVTASVRSVKELEDAGRQVLLSPAANISWMWYNYAWVEGHPFNDRRVREALSIAIDREAIGTGLYAGQTTPACCYWVVEGNVGYPGDVAPPPYDPERAQQLLKDAGYEGMEMELFTFSGDADFADQPGLTEAIAGYFEAIGLKPSVKVVDAPVLRETFSTATKDQAQIDEAVAQQPPYQVAVRGSDTRPHSYRGSQIYYHSEGRWQLTKAPEILDPLLDVAAGAFSLDEQHKAMADFHRLLANDYWVAPLLEAGAVFGASEKVQDWQPITGKPYPHNHWTIRPPQ